MTCVFLEGKRELKDAHKNQRKEGGKRVSITDNTLSTNLIGRHYKTYRFELICPADIDREAIKSIEAKCGTAG